jgi:hypothetical protein
LKLSIVTPTYQHAAFLEAAMRSVLDQNYPELEYLVVDGGSTDGSVDIIKRYADRLAYWVSERDGGHFFALNKGFEKTTGEVMGFINSDDVLMPWSLNVVAEIFETHPEIEWLTSLMPLRLDARGRVVRCLPARGFSRKGFVSGENLPTPGHFVTGWIQQESTFWRRSLWEKAGARCATDLPLAADWELWHRFFQHAELYGVETPLGAFRIHGAQKTVEGFIKEGAEKGQEVRGLGGLERYVVEGERILARDGHTRPGVVRDFLRRMAFESCPRSLQFIAGQMGLLHPAKIVRHNRSTGNWRIDSAWC